MKVWHVAAGAFVAFLAYIWWKSGEDKKERDVPADASGKIESAIGGPASPEASAYIPQGPSAAQLGGASAVITEGNIATDVEPGPGYQSIGDAPPLASPVQQAGPVIAPGATVTPQFNLVSASPPPMSAPSQAPTAMVPAFGTPMQSVLGQYSTVKVLA